MDREDADCTSRRRCPPDTGQRISGHYPSHSGTAATERPEAGIATSVPAARSPLKITECRFRSYGSPFRFRAGPAGPLLTHWAGSGRRTGSVRSIAAQIPATVTVILAAVERLLTELGAMTEEQLLVGLRNAGLTSVTIRRKRWPICSTATSCPRETWSDSAVSQPPVWTSPASTRRRPGRRRRGVASTILGECGGGEQEQARLGGLDGMRG